MRVLALASVVLVAEAKDFCCYYPVASDLSSCNDCSEKHYDTDGKSDCLSDKDNTWCPSAAPQPPSPAPPPSPPSPAGWKKSTWTAYESWPRCCKGSPNYDPKAPKDECTDDSGCKYQGMFAYKQCSGKDGQCTLDWVKSHNLVSFFSVSGEHKKYKNKMIRITAKSKTIEALVVDTCGDGDCGGCCTKNAKQSKGGFLIDMEYYTVQKYWPDIKEPEVNLFETDITWEPVDSNFTVAV